MKNISKEIKFLIFSALILSGFFFSSVVFGAGFLSFGGKVTGKLRCTCGVGYQITVKGGLFNAKYSGTYLYLPGTPKGTITTGKNILGKYSSGGECMDGHEPDCTDLPISKGTIKSFGVSSSFLGIF